MFLLSFRRSFNPSTNLLINFIMIDRWDQIHVISRSPYSTSVQYWSTAPTIKCHESQLPYSEKLDRKIQEKEDIKCPYCNTSHKILFAD